MNQASILSHVSKGKKPPQAADGINQGQPGHYSYSQKLLAKRTQKKANQTPVIMYQTDQPRSFTMQNAQNMKNLKQSLESGNQQKLENIMALAQSEEIPGMAGGGSAPGPVNKPGVHSPSQSFNKYTNQPMTQLEHIYAQVGSVSKSSKMKNMNKSPDYEQQINTQLGPRSFVSLTA